MRKELLFVGLALVVLGGLAGFAVVTRPGAVDLDRAVSIAEGYAAKYGGGVAVDEVMEFQHNFYAVFVEKPTGMGAFEMLIDRSTGAISPEYGPNMMWNTRYGHGGMMGGGMMGYGQAGPMTVTEAQALKAAQVWLDANRPGEMAEDAHTFYGYYTIHTVRGGAVAGMLSVNGYTGAVWYHTWHGAFIGERELLG